MAARPDSEAPGASVAQADCAICAMVAAEPAAGWVYEDESWVAGALDGLEIPGWIVLVTRRHTVGPAPLSPEEAARMGVAIGRLSRALAEVTEAERVYLQAYGENQAHWHLLLCARGPEVPAEHRHVAFFTHRDHYLDAPAAARVLDRVRVWLRSPPNGCSSERES